MKNYNSIDYNHYLHKTYEERLKFFNLAYDCKENLIEEPIGTDIQFSNVDFSVSFCNWFELIPTCFYIPKDKSDQIRNIYDLEGVFINEQEKNGNSLIKKRYIIDRKKQKYFDSRYSRLYWRPYYIKSMLFIVTFLEEKFNSSKLNTSYINEDIIHHFLSSLSIKSDDDQRDHQNLFFLSSESSQIVQRVIYAYQEFITLLINPIDDVVNPELSKRFIEIYPSKSFTELQNTLIKYESYFSSENFSNLLVQILQI